MQRDSGCGSGFLRVPGHISSSVFKCRRFLSPRAGKQIHNVYKVVGEAWRGVSSGAATPLAMMHEHEDVASLLTRLERVWFYLCWYFLIDFSLSVDAIRQHDIWQSLTATKLVINACQSSVAEGNILGRDSASTFPFTPKALKGLKEIRGRRKTVPHNVSPTPRWWQS